MITRADIFHRHAGIVAGRPYAADEIARNAVIELVARRHGARLLFGHAHQPRLEHDWRKAVVAPIAGNHRLRRIDVEFAAGAGEAAIEAWLAGRRIAVAERGATGKRC